MTPIGWAWGLFVWIYAIVWFIFNDAVKMAVIKYYRKTKGEEIL
jgi:H+-transporting ATPase